MSTKASRHKSCLKCISTKRKCDRTQPGCRRCIASNSVCQYIGRNRGQQQQPSTQPSGADQSFFPVSTELLHGAQQLPANWALQPYHTAALMTSLPTPYLDGSIFEFPNHPFNLGEMPYDDDALQFSCNDSNTNSSVAVQVSSSTNLCTARPITQFTPPEAVIRPRVEFVAKRLASIPRRFASEAQTMFIHRIHFQYTCPPALQDAMSACALYSMKTVANQGLVLGHVQRKCEQLVASTDAVVVERNELLAALQALLLYQMTRLFDGDIRLRVLAETDEAVALQWAQRLKASLRDDDDDDDDAVVFQSVYSRDQVTCQTSQNSGLRNSSSDTWHGWLATESIRRTIITTYILSGIYNFLKLGYDGPTPDLRLAFTAQTALWNAQSETGWRWARDDGSIENLEMRVEMWDEVMGKAGPRDLEEMGVVVMVMLWGVEGARRWLGREVGGRFGLGEGE